MAEFGHGNTYDRRAQRILHQVLKVEGLSPGSEERAIEELILTTMLSSAVIGDMADAMSELETKLECGHVPNPD